MTRQLTSRLLKRALHTVLFLELFVCTDATAQNVTADSVTVNPTNTATSSSGFNSGIISLNGSVWNGSSAVPLKQTIKNITPDKNNTMLLFEVDPGGLDYSWVNNTVRFKGVNTALEATNDNEAFAVRFMATYSKALFGLTNLSASAHGIVPGNDFIMTFGTDFAGRVGSLVPYRWGDPVFRNVLDDGTGKMGIGTPSPAAQLHTTGSVRFAGITNDNTATRVVSMDSSGNLYYRDAATLSGSGNWSLSGTNIYNANTGLVIIGGSVNPAPADPDLKFAVNGNIYGKKLKITQTGWADYVFDPTYKLRSLKEVEAFIQKNQHLPDVPSAKEVENNGIDVGDNQAVLLKKVEELTLYVIEQNKKQEAQNKVLGQMKKEIERLKKRHAKK